MAAMPRAPSGGLRASGLPAPTPCRSYPDADKTSISCATFDRPCRLSVAGKMRGLEVKLMTGTYKNIEEDHRRKLIEHRTTEMAVTDLDKYWTALDKVRRRA